MPLRDHFRPPLSSRHSWEGLSAQWAAVVVQQLHSSLPEEYAAEPAVPTGAVSELDAVPHVVDASPVWTAPAPTFTVDTDLPCENACAVRVYDMRCGRQLVAAIEIVSPANKDRPEHRRAFAVKAAAVLGPVFVRGADDLDRRDQLPAAPHVVHAHRARVFAR